MFSAKDVKDLREKTGAGMLDCKKALEASEGNMDKAIDWLREKGIAKAAKKESRIAAEGLTEGAVNGNTAIVFEVNCETDFVTKNEKFQNLIAELKDALLNKIQELYNQEMDSWAAKAEPTAAQENDHNKRLAYLEEF